MIIITSTSFTLGFFVGKTVSDNTTISPIIKKQKTPLTIQDKTLIDLRLAKKEEMKEQKSTKKSEAKGINEFHSPDSQQNRTVQVKQAPVALKNPPKKDMKKYFIQVAALRNASDAKKMQESFEIKGFRSIIVKQRIKNEGTFYKVRLLGFKTKEEATKVLETLNKKGIEGFIVKSETKQ